MNTAQHVRPKTSRHIPSMKTSKVLLASLLLAGTVALAFAGPGPQYWQKIGTAKKDASPAPAANTSEQSQCCANCAQSVCAAMAKK
jgi:hypothetical protein